MSTSNPSYPYDPLRTLNQIEQNLSNIDPQKAAASQAVSLRRIADALEKLVALKEKEVNKVGGPGYDVAAG